MKEDLRDHYVFHGYYENLLCYVTDGVFFEQDSQLVRHSSEFVHYLLKWVCCPLVWVSDRAEFDFHLRRGVNKQ